MNMMMKIQSTTFSGPEVKAGAVTMSTEMGRPTLTLSDDFTVPGAPAPHWRVVDSMGNAYLLQRLVTMGDRFNKTITLPTYVKDVARVQIYCAFAEVVLGEVRFDGTK